MRNRIKYTFAVLVLLMLASCNEWLKVSPKNRVDGVELLANTEGFNSALGGIYSRMSENSQYGASLEFEMIDAMVGYWTILPEHSLFPFTQYNYTDSKVSGRLSTLWSSMYANVAQCNHIIESLDEVDASDVEYFEIIKGEAYGLRAFLHMELLKMFGPAIAMSSDMDKRAIPYRTKFDKHAIEFHTYKEVLDLAREDLLTAVDAMGKDPIDELGREGNGNTSNLMNYIGLLDFRAARMNKYAVYALLARLEMMANNKPKALEYANLFIEPQGLIPFRFVADNEILTPPTDNTRDLKFSSEIIFSLFINKHYENTGDLLGYADYKPTKNTSLYPDVNKYRNFYINGEDCSPDDYRYKYWFKNNGDNAVLAKYQQPAAVGPGVRIAYQPEVALLRLPELYYIASECNIGIDNTKALSLLNAVRSKRGLAPIVDIVDSDRIMDLLVKEQQKEFFGEGKMFFLFKRLFRNISDLTGLETAASQQLFMFPIPDDEYEFSPNEKPKK